MSNLIKFDESLAPALSVQERKIVLASQSLRLNESEPMDLVVAMVGHITEALVILGHSKKVTENDIGVMSKLIVEKLIEKHPTYRADEIWNAIRNGAFGEYDDNVVFVSASNILKWCEAYQSKKSEVLMKQMKHNEKLKDEERERISQERANKYWDELHIKIKNDYDCYMDHSPISISSWVYFESLQNIGIINVSKADKLAKFKEVKDKTIAESQMRYEKFDMSMILHKSKNDCKTFFYQKYLSEIEEISVELDKIRDKSESMKIF